METLKPTSETHTAAPLAEMGETNAPHPKWDPIVRAAVIVGAAALLSVIAPPLNLHFLHWFAYIPVFWVLRPGQTSANAAFALLYAVVAEAVIFRWLVDTITLFSNIPIAGAVAILLGFSTAFGLPMLAFWLAVQPTRRWLGDAWIVVAPAWLVVVEFLAMHIVLFPFNQGVSQYRFPFVWQLASITGVWGVSWLVMFVNAAFAEAIYRFREGRPFPTRWVASAVLIWSLVVVYGARRFEYVESALREAPVLRVAQLQSDMTMLQRMRTPPRETYEYWVHKTQSIPPGAVDLVVWPEGASPYSLQNSRRAGEFRRLAETGGFELVVGGGARGQVPGTGQKTGLVSFNSVYHVSKDGEVTGRYDKMVPLPFGEYMPLSKSPLGFLVNWIEGVGDFQAGTEAIVLEGGPYRYATPICYEAILSGICRRFDQPDLFVTVTNDAWFGDTAAPHLHAMLAAVRATELGVPVYRSAYTGVSLAIEPHGVIHSETRPFDEVDRVVGVRVAKFPTAYARFGDWFVVLCIATVAGAITYAFLRSRRRLG